MTDREPMARGFLLGVGSFILILIVGWSGAGEAADATSSWQSAYWQIEGRTLERTGPRIVGRDVRMRARSKDWSLRAERWVGLADPRRPGELLAWRARGSVRAVGPRPGYVTGERAVSFRPGRTFVVLAESGTVDWIGRRWRLPAREISVDMEGARIEARDLGAQHRTRVEQRRFSAPETEGS